MAFLIFALVLAFILEDYGTLTKPVDQCEDDELVELFKKYALGFVTAAAVPLRNNDDMLEWAKDCIPIFAERGRVIHTDIFVATASLVRDNYPNLLAMSQTSAAASSRRSKYTSSGSKEEMMKNIRTILYVLENYTKKLDVGPSINVFSVYAAKHEEGTPEYDRNSDSIASCMRFVISMNFAATKTFFDKLTRGFTILAHIMSKSKVDDKSSVLANSSKWNDLLKISDEISQYKLNTQALKSLEATMMQQLLEKGGSGLMDSI